MTTVLADLKPALENLFDNSALYFSLVVSMNHAGTLTKSFILSKKSWLWLLILQANQRAKP